MGRYSKQSYDLPSLDCTVQFEIGLDGDKTHIHLIQNQIIFNLEKLNFITTLRTESVNNYRKIQHEQDELTHKKYFEDIDTENDEAKLKKRFSPVLKSIGLYTEIYFLYAKILLDSIGDIVYLYEDKLPSNPKRSFSKLYYDIHEKGCKNPHLESVIKNELNWYPLMIQVPRNQLLVHDVTSSGASWNDHGVDISFLKSGLNYTSEEELNNLLNIFNNHNEEFNINTKGKYIYPILREFLRKPEVFTDEEINELVRISKKFPTFPYVADVHPRLQNFLDFISHMIQTAKINGYW